MGGVGKRNENSSLGKIKKKSLSQAHTNAQNLKIWHQRKFHNHNKTLQLICSMIKI